MLKFGDNAILLVQPDRVLQTPPAHSAPDANKEYYKQTPSSRGETIDHR